MKATPEEAMQKIVLVKDWWAKKCKGKTAEAGDKFTVTFGDTFVDFTITEHVPGKKIVWTVTDCNLHWLDAKKEWLGNDMVFELTPSGNTTKIAFTHIGLTPDKECFGDCKIGWTDHITASLKNLINKGKGKPE